LLSKGDRGPQLTTPHLDGEIRDGRHHMQVRVYYEDTPWDTIIGIRKPLCRNDFLCCSARREQIHALYGGYPGVGRKLIGHPLRSWMNHDAVNEIAEGNATFWRIRFVGRGPVYFKDALAIDIPELRRGNRKLKQIIAFSRST
jgi:hypothetical protein